MACNLSARHKKTCITRLSSRYRYDISLEYLTNSPSLSLLLSPLRQGNYATPNPHASFPFDSPEVGNHSHIPVLCGCVCVWSVCVANRVKDSPWGWKNNLTRYNYSTTCKSLPWWLIVGRTHHGVLFQTVSGNPPLSLTSNNTPIGLQWRQVLM